MRFTKYKRVGLETREPKLLCFFKDSNRRSWLIILVCDTSRENLRRQALLLQNYITPGVPTSCQVGANRH